MKKLVVVLCCLGLALAVVSCSMKVPAQAAIKAGEEALNAVKAEAVKYIPDQYAAVEKVLGDAKAALEKGDYKGAIQIAKEVPQKANDLLAAIEARKAELPGVWTEMVKAVPKLIADTKAQLSKAKGLDKAAKDEAGTKVKEMEEGWKKAEGEFKNGNLLEAVNLAEQVKKTALLVQGLLSMKTAGK
jgi:hypothetical protein